MGRKGTTGGHWRDADPGEGAGPAHPKALERCAHAWEKAIGSGKGRAVAALMHAEIVAMAQR